MNGIELNTKGEVLEIGILHSSRGSWHVALWPCGGRISGCGLNSNLRQARKAFLAKRPVLPGIHLTARRTPPPSSAHLRSQRQSGLLTVHSLKQPKCSLPDTPETLRRRVFAAARR